MPGILVQVVHGPHSEKFFKINLYAWLPLQGSPGVDFIILEIRVKEASGLVHPAVPQRLLGPRFLPFSMLWYLACPLVLSYHPSESPDSYRVLDIVTSRSDNARSHVFILLLLKKEKLLFQMYAQ